MENDLFFEIRDTGNYIRIEPVIKSYPNSNDDWDENWLTAGVHVKAGSFTGKYVAQLMTYDFKYLYDNISKLYDNLSGHVSFSDLEGYIELNISGDGIGHFNVAVIANDRLQFNGCLNFSLSFDQTQIEGMVNQLDKINKVYNIK